MSRPLSAASRLALSKDQVSCDLAGEVAIVNLQRGVYYGLDPTGTRIWNLLRQPLTFGELCSSLESIYDVAHSTLESDARAFIGDLADHGLIEIT